MKNKEFWLIPDFLPQTKCDPAYPAISQGVQPFEDPADVTGEH